MHHTVIVTLPIMQWVDSAVVIGRRTHTAVTFTVKYYGTDTAACCFHLFLNPLLRSFFWDEIRAAEFRKATINPTHAGQCLMI